MSVVNALLDLFNSPNLGALTEHRNFGSVTFLGRYSLADIMLSNFTNSGIGKVGILVDHFVQTMRTHVNTGSAFVNNTRTGGLDIVYDEQGMMKPQFYNDVKDLIDNPTYVEDIISNYVVVAPAHILLTFNFKELIKYHEQSGNDITMMYQHRDDLKKKFINQYVLTLKDNGLVKSIKKNDGSVNEGDASLEIYVFSRETLMDLLNDQPLVSQKYGIKEMVAYYVRKNKKIIGGYKFDGYVLPIFNLDDYVEASFDLLPYENRLKFFKEDWPIYTTTHNTPPAQYGPLSEVKNSFIANGARINGKVENSIISRGVVIKEDAIVKNSILFTDTVVEKSVKLEYVLTDKRVVVDGEGKSSYRGTKKQMLVIKQGQK